MEKTASFLVVSDGAIRGDEMGETYDYMVVHGERTEMERMKIEIEDGVLKLSGPYSRVILEANNGVELTVSQRNGVFKMRTNTKGKPCGKWHKIALQNECDKDECTERLKEEEH